MIAIEGLLKDKVGGSLERVARDKLVLKGGSKGISSLCTIDITIFIKERDGNTYELECSWEKNQSLWMNLLLIGMIAASIPDPMCLPALIPLFVAYYVANPTDYLRSIFENF